MEWSRLLDSPNRRAEYRERLMPYFLAFLIVVSMALAALALGMGLSR